MIQPTLLLGLPAHMRLEQIEIAEQIIVLSLFLETSEAACPLCQQTARRVHSHYVRTLQDMPCVGKILRLRVQVRRFFCENSVCARKIFAERLPELTSVYARRTTMREWATQELEGEPQTLTSSFLFTTQPQPPDPRWLWLEPCWFTPSGEQPVSLLGV